MEIEEVLQTQIRDTSGCKGGDVDISWCTSRELTNPIIRSDS